MLGGCRVVKWCGPWGLEGGSFRVGNEYWDENVVMVMLGM